MAAFPSPPNSFRDQGHHSRPEGLGGDDSILNCCMFFTQGIEKPRKVRGIRHGRRSERPLHVQRRPLVHGCCLVLRSFALLILILVSLPLFCVLGTIDLNRRKSTVSRFRSRKSRYFARDEYQLFG